MTSADATSAVAVLHNHAAEVAESSLTTVADLRELMAAWFNVPSSNVDVQVSGSRGAAVVTRIVVEARS
jgi:hypothetical protein